MRLIFIFIIVIIVNYNLQAKKNKDTSLKLLCLPEMNTALSEISDRIEHDLSKNLKNLKKYLKGYDVIFTNLSTPITHSEEYQRHLKKAFYFKSDESDIQALSDIGVNIVSLANNNIMDYYEVGLFDTIKTLNEYNIFYVGAGSNLIDARESVIFKKNDIRVGFLAYNRVWPYEYRARYNKPGNAWAYLKYIKKDIARLKAKTDFIVVNVNFGKIFSKYPENELFTKKNKMLNVRVLARKIIDLGADIVISENAKRIQGIERYNKGVIFYSLGTLFPLRLKTKYLESYMLKIEFKNKKVFAYETVPLKSIVKDGKYCPVMLYGPKREKVLKEINNLSIKLNQ